MRIFIDLGHPAHIHYFKNFIRIMKSNGHEILLVARNKDVLHQLISNLGYEFIDRGKGAKSFLSRIAYLVKTDIKLFLLARKFKPDLFLSFASTYAAHASFLYRRPHVVIDDTEHAKFELFLYSPFSDTILNPISFWKRYSKKQIFFDSFIELSHLHPRYFEPNIHILEKYSLKIEEHFFIVRFVSWEASHDVGEGGLSLDEKVKIVEFLSKKGRVIISSEMSLPLSLESFRLKIEPQDLHNLLFYSQLYIGEGATTASECVILGTPAIYINSLDAGTISEQAEKFGLVSLRNSHNIFEKINDLLLEGAKENALVIKQKLLEEKIDITQFLVWFIENYPSSRSKLMDDPSYQYKFK